MGANSSKECADHRDQSREQGLDVRATGPAQLGTRVELGSPRSLPARRPHIPTARMQLCHLCGPGWECRHLGRFHSLAIMNNAAKTIRTQVFVWTEVLISPGKHTSGE